MFVTSTMRNLLPMPNALGRIHGWNLVSPGQKASSHRGHKTGVSVLDALTEGKSRAKIMEWRLVTDEILVAHYYEREHIVTPLVTKRFDWM